MIDNKTEIFLQHNIKGLMQDCLSNMNLHLHKKREKSEYASLRDGDIRLFAQLRGRTLTISQLARESGISRQGAQQAISRLLQKDMVSLENEQMGKKGKCIHITSKGQAFRHFIATELQQFEAELKQKIGEEEVETLRSLLQKVSDCGQFC